MHSLWEVKLAAPTRGIPYSEFCGVSQVRPLHATQVRHGKSYAKQALGSVRDAIKEVHHTRLKRVLRTHYQ